MERYAIICKRDKTSSNKNDVISLKPFLDRLECNQIVDTINDDLQLIFDADKIFVKAEDTKISIAAIIGDLTEKIKTLEKEKTEITDKYEQAAKFYEQTTAELEYNARPKCRKCGKVVKDRFMQFCPECEKTIEELNRAKSIILDSYDGHCDKTSSCVNHNRACAMCNKVENHPDKLDMFRPSVKHNKCLICHNHGNNSTAYGKGGCLFGYDTMCYYCEEGSNFSMINGKNFNAQPPTPRKAIQVGREYFCPNCKDVINPFLSACTCGQELINYI